MSSGRLAERPEGDGVDLALEARCAYGRTVNADTWCWRTVCLAILALVALTNVSAHGGEGELPFDGEDLALPGEEEAGEEKPWWERPKEEYTLEQVRIYQSFVYTPGQRNPFQFRLPITEEEEEGEGAKPPGTGEGTSGSRRPEPPPADEQNQYLMEQLLRIELRMLGQEYKKAIKACEEVRTTVMDAWGGPPTRQDNYRLFQKIVAYSRTAKRLQQALETRKEFENLSIDVKGIRWTPQGSSALINHKIYESGSVLEDLSGSAPVQIEMITEDSVLFLYKGQRFRKALVEGIEQQMK